MGKGFAKKVIVKTATFCWKHKFLVGLGASMLGAYCYGRHVQADIYSKQGAAIQEERGRMEKIEEWEQKRKEYEENPENHLGDCGLVEDDWWDEGIDTCPVGNMIISGANLTDMGDLGDEILERVEKGKCGSMDQETLLNLVHGNHKVDLILTVSPDEKPKEEPDTCKIVNHIQLKDVPKDIAEPIAQELHDACHQALMDICDKNGLLPISDSVAKTTLKDAPADIIESAEKELMEEVE